MLHDFKLIYFSCCSFWTRGILHYRVPGQCTGKQRDPVVQETAASTRGTAA